jgi:hypothetical protein
MEKLCILVAENNANFERNTARVASRCFIHSLLFLDGQNTENWMESRVKCTGG